MEHEEDSGEDLLEEATALVERVRLRINDYEKTVVVGFRRDGGASFYFDLDTAYHFNPQGKLRRAFDAGRMFKAEKGRLLQLARSPSEGRVQLVSHVLGEQQSTRLLAALTESLARLERALATEDFAVIGQVPPAGNVVDRARQWLAAHRGPIEIAQRPNVQ